ncbi:hypothetical protein SK128_002740 [Halocaridina rubra]|uniref:Uncharacterized protein n=1 Tax=Halocaridina rubra TaxID=373956 RepID=A0AAN8WYG2_HALRR
MQNKNLEKLDEFDVIMAPKLTIASARILVKNCPKLRQLQNLGGWNINPEEYNAFLKETTVQNYDIQIVCKPQDSRLLDEFDRLDADTSYDSDVELEQAILNLQYTLNYCLLLKLCQIQLKFI